MHILVAPDSFKGTLRATEAAVAIRSGLLRANPDFSVQTLPLADGGEGSLDAVLAALGGTSHAIRVHDPFGELHSEHIGLLPDDTVFIETALFCGLGTRRWQDLDPTVASSFGLGEAITAALALRPKRLLVGVGGTITADAGLGMWAAQSQGTFDAALDDEAWPTILSTLSSAARWKRRLLAVKHALCDVEIVALVDVSVPLQGPSGAAQFLAQKSSHGGADLDFTAFSRAWAELAQVLTDEQEGDGAGGGLGFGLRALGAVLKSGADMLLEVADVERHLANADVVVTGEGRLDRQTGHGKLIARLVQRAQAVSKPVHAVCGEVTLSPLDTEQLGLATARSCDTSNRPAFVRLRDAATDLGRALAATTP